MPFQRKDKNGVVVMKDGKAVIDWATAIGIGATRINVRRQRNYRYIKDSPRPATDDEQIKYRGKVDKTHLWHITWLQDVNTKEEVFGLGNWPLYANGQPYKVKGSEKGNTPEHMADIRSERAASDKFCPEWLPPGLRATVRVIDEQYEDLPPEQPAAKASAGGGAGAGPGVQKVIQVGNQQVVESTGEIVGEIGGDIGEESGDMEQPLDGDQETDPEDLETAIFGEGDASPRPGLVSQVIVNPAGPVKPEEGSDVWLTMKLAILNIKDAAVIDTLSTRYKIPIAQLDTITISKNFKLLKQNQREDLVKLLKNKEAELNPSQ
jgi:hypothetical protein